MKTYNSGKTAHGCLRVKLLFFLDHPFLVHTWYYIQMHCTEDTKFPGTGNQKMIMYVTRRSSTQFQQVLILVHLNNIWYRERGLYKIDQNRVCQVKYGSVSITWNLIRMQIHMLHLVIMKCRLSRWTPERGCLASPSADDRNYDDAAILINAHIYLLHTVFTFHPYHFIPVSSGRQPQRQKCKLKLCRRNSERH